MKAQFLADLSSSTLSWNIFDRNYLLNTANTDFIQVSSSQTEPSSSNGNNNGNKAVVTSDGGNAVVDVLENTLWNRQLGAMSEEIVAALVCQIFEGKSPEPQFAQSFAFNKVQVLLVYGVCYMNASITIFRLLIHHIGSKAPVKSHMNFFSH